MRLGIFFGARRETVSYDDLTQHVRRAEADGFSHFWVPHLPTLGFDALTTLALVGRETTRIELGTAVVPVYSYHPLALAQHALTAQSASGGRLSLGIGLSHKPVVEDVMGLSYARPAGYMDEYLSVLRPLLSEGRVDFSGDVFKVNAQLHVQHSSPFPVLIAALAPRMLRLAGEQSDGTVTWMAGRQAIASHIAPRIGDAARAAGRPAPRICVGLPIAVTDDEVKGRETADQEFNRYGQLVNYRRMLDIEEVAGPADVAVVGNESQVEAQLRALADAGATDFLASIFPVGDDADASMTRTWNLLKALQGKI
ncbi:TIGR03564 family F420-dependent LLM class oxidoreductase [Candidatus Entotheonella palauensis]|nr:TIGR03564 family F420-dependent LLM class oxidoreductase [Candidatus Entotheonella palauensis]